MSKPPELTQIRPEDFKEDDREMANVLAGVLNNFILQITQLLNQSLTFSDNFSSEVRTFNIKGSDGITFKLDTVKDPKGLLLLQFQNLTNPNDVIAGHIGTPQWAGDGKGNIEMEQLWGLTNADTYAITILVISG